MAGSAKPKPAGVDAPQLARLFGVSDREIRDMAVRGIVVKVGRGRYDLQASIQKTFAHYREQAAARQGKDGLDNVSENALLTRERRRKLQQDAERDAGKLISVETVVAIMVDHITGMKALVLGLSNEVQSELPHIEMADLLKIRALCEKWLRNNAERVIHLDGLHPEIKQYIDELRGKGTI